MRRTAFLLFMLPVLLAAALLPACARSPIPASAPRSPYERFEVLRGEKPPKTITNSFGRQQPNLRGRLGGTSSQ